MTMMAWDGRMEEETTLGTAFGDYYIKNDDGSVQFDYNWAIEDIWDIDDSDEAVALGTLHRIYTVTSASETQKNELRTLVEEYLHSMSRPGARAIELVNKMKLLFGVDQAEEPWENDFCGVCMTLIHVAMKKHAGLSGQ